MCLLSSQFGECNLVPWKLRRITWQRHRKLLGNSEPAATAMPKNKGKGGRNRRKGKKENEYEKRDLVFKEDGQGKNSLFILFLVM